MNNINLVGRLVKDAELKKYETNHILTFTVAVDRDYVKKDGSRETDYINCEYSRKDLSKLEPFVKKGVLISITGSLNLDKYTKDNEVKYFTKVRAKDLKLLSKAQEGAITESEVMTDNSQPVDDSDIPF